MPFQNSVYNIKLEKVTKDTPFVFFCGFTFFILVLTLKFAIIPVVYNIISVREELNNYKKLINSESGFLKIKKEIKTKIDSLQRMVDNLTELKKGRTEINNYIEKLMEVSRESNVNFVRIEPQSEEKKSSNSDYLYYPVLLALTTDYHQCVKFISSLEKKQHLFRIERIALDASKDQKCNIKILVTCIIPKGKVIDVNK